MTQENQTQLENEINTELASGQTGGIVASQLQEVLTDIVDSPVDAPIDSTSGLEIATPPNIGWNSGGIGLGDALDWPASWWTYKTERAFPVPDSISYDAKLYHRDGYLSQWHANRHWLWRVLVGYDCY